MAQQTINVGTAPNDGTGTPLRTAFQYTNSNFSELYTAVGPSGNNIVVPGSATITGDLTVDTNVLKVDTSNNRVGVTTASPFCAFHTNNDGVASGAGWTAIGRFNNVANTKGLDLGYNPSNNNAVITALSGGATSGFEFWSFDGSWSNRMTLNSTGLGVGTSNFAYKINAAGFIAAVDPSFTGTGGSLIGAMLNNDNTAPGLDLRRWTGTAGTHGTTYIATDATGATFFYNGQQASNTKATSLKMTLDASGNLLVGVTSGGTARLDIRTSASQRIINAFSTAAGDSSTYGVYIAKFANDSTTAQRFIGFTINNDGAGSGQINANGASQAAFGTFSDSRLKENIVSLPSQLANILSLRPVEFDYKDGSGHQIGFVAQEMQQVYSDAVGESDGFLTVTGWSKTEARLVSAIKELAAKVQALEAKLA